MGALKNLGLVRLWSHVCTRFNGLSNQISSLTAADVGAMSVGTKGAGGDFNSLVEPGCYRIEYDWLNGPPSVDVNFGNVLVVRGENSDTVTQIAFDYLASRACIRSGQGYWGDYTTISWKPWRTILTSGETLIIGSQNYGDTPPETAVEGQVFFKRVT